MFTILNEADSFNPNQSEIDSVDIDIIIAAYNGSGVISGGAVTAQGTPDMTVAVASGEAIIDGTKVTIGAGNVTITTADATNARVDLIVINSSTVKSAIVGTPATQPVAPAIPVNSIVLAMVYVPASDTTIETNQITDKRIVLGSLLSPGFADNAELRLGTDNDWLITFNGTNLTIVGTGEFQFQQGTIISALTGALGLTSVDDAVNVVTGAGAGDDFTINTTAFVVSGDGGSIGIGTATPGKLLDISNLSGAADVRLIGSGGNVEHTITDEYDINYTRTTGDPTIDFRALAGDGTSTAEYRFGIDSGTTGANRLILFEANGVIRQTQLATSGENSYLNSQGGNLGINTTLPQSILDIQGDAGTAGILTVATKELTVVDGDILGRINFNAPLESAGGDAILVAASIWAEADATFSSIVNTTDLVFATGNSEAAVEKWRITALGDLKATAGGQSIVIAGATSGTLTITVPATITSFTMTLPSADGSASDFIQTDGAGNLSFAPVSGAPTTADYLVGTAQGGLSAEIVVGATPGGELGGTWATPTVDATHSGSTHHTQAHTDADHTNMSTSNWTPVLTFGGGNTGMTGTFNGWYVRLGDNAVFIKGEIALTAKGSSTGTAEVTGLPFTATSDSGVAGMVVGYLSDITVAAGHEAILARVLPSTTKVVFVEQSLSGGSFNLLDDTDFGATGPEIHFSGVYRI